MARGRRAAPGRSARLRACARSRAPPRRATAPGSRAPTTATSSWAPATRPGRRRGAYRSACRSSSTPSIDACATITVDAPVAGDVVVAHLPSKRHVGSKLVIVEGLDSESGVWEAPAVGRRYGELQAGVQLASRTGALNEIEYSEFVQRMQAFAEAIGASMDPPDMLDVMARARELDAFASQHDAAARGPPARARRGVERRLHPAARAPPRLRSRRRARPARLPVDRGGRAAGAHADLRLAGGPRRRARPCRGARRDARLRRAADRPVGASRSRPGRRRRRRSPSAWTPPSSTTTAGRSAAPASRRSVPSSARSTRRSRRAAWRRDRRRRGACSADAAAWPRAASGSKAARDAAKRARPSCAQQIERHAHAYYVLDAPKIPDADYDALFQELQAIEAEHPELRVAGLADPARHRRRPRRSGAGSPRGADALDQHRDRHHGRWRREIRRARAAGARPRRRPTRRSPTPPR